MTVTPPGGKYGVAAGPSGGQYGGNVTGPFSGVFGSAVMSSMQQVVPSSQPGSSTLSHHSPGNITCIKCISLSFR